MAQNMEKLDEPVNAVAEYLKTYEALGRANALFLQKIAQDAQRQRLKSGKRISVIQSAVLAKKV